MKKMTKSEARTIARRLMQDNGVTYLIEFNNNKQRLGVCKHAQRTVEFSTHFMNHISYDEMLDTIRHEVAHAAVGPGHGHNHVWRSKFLSLGGSGNRVANSNMPASTYRYHLHCSVTDELINTRHRRSALLDRAICLCHRKPAYVVDTRDPLTPYIPPTSV